MGNYNYYKIDVGNVCIAYEKFLNYILPELFDNVLY